VPEFGDAYRLTCSVLDMAQQAGRRDRVVSLDDAGTYRLLLQVKQPRELGLFAASTLGAVHDYDRRRQTQLAARLRTHLAQQCNMATTARELHVHPNTVAYRLRRIEKLLGIELTAPAALLQIQLALMIEGILGDG
jgi:DNA-binding PucR family transcriptional regulator